MMSRLLKVGLTITLLSLLAPFAVAEKTQGSGKGFSTIADSKTIEGKSGTIVHNTAVDYWHYEKAPKGWPTAVMATCHQSILFKAGSPAPIAIQMICESVDKEGDASVWVGKVDPKTGVGQGEMVSGTGKYANIEVKPTFQTIYQIDTGHSVYKFSW